MKRTMIAVALSLCAAAITGCASAPTKTINFNDPADVRANVIVKKDDFAKTTTFSAPTINVGEVVAPGGGESTGPVRISLNAYHSAQILEYDITISIAYYDFDWRNYSAVYDRDGNRFQPHVDRQVVSCRSKCTYLETISFKVSRSYLEAHMNSPVTAFRVKSGMKDFDFTLPGPYLAGVLATVDASTKVQ